MKQENFPPLAPFSVWFLGYWELFVPKIPIASDETQSSVLKY